MRAFLPALALFLVVLPGSARAHIGASGAADVAAGSAGDIALEEAWGLLLSDGSGFEWVCHEILTAPGVVVQPAYVMNDDGVLLGLTGLGNGSRVDGESVYRSEDGCSWVPPAGLSDRIVAQAAFAPGMPQVALAVSADYAVDGYDNVIARSTDAGATFEVVRSVSDVLLRDVTFGAGGTAWVVGVAEDPPAALLYRSDDAGLTWDSVPIDGSGAESLFFPSLLGTHPTDADVFWLGLDGNSADLVLRTSDGGDSFAPVSGAPAALVDLVPQGDGAWITSGDRELLWAADGVAFGPVEAPQVWGGGMRVGTLLLAADTSRERTALWSRDGEEFAPVFETADLRAPSCAPGTEVGDECAPLWDELVVWLEANIPPDETGDDDDSGSGEPPPPGCGGCAGVGQSVAPWESSFLLLVLGAYLVRRRTQ
ncbi:MAG: hypothetical protein KDA24_09255 [Deltaproteobacteria bacterium]|nr:hypothetical protein [Deltaproteobacteria bacterium]